MSLPNSSAGLIRNLEPNAGSPFLVDDGDDEELRPGGKKLKIYLIRELFDICPSIVTEGLGK
jgi:hypothetical protein